jgi:hypothetical protein
MVVHQLHFLLNLWFICMFMKMLLILCPYHHNHYQHQNNLHQNTCQVDKNKIKKLQLEIFSMKENLDYDKLKIKVDD